MSDAIGWMIHSVDGISWLTTEPGEAKEAPNYGYSVTPLVAAPPEDGRPTYDELVEALREYIAADEAVDREAERTAENPAGWSSAYVVRRSHAVDAFRDLLARIPKEG